MVSGAFLTLGNIALAPMGYYSASWRQLYVLTALPSLAFCVLAYFVVPESFHYAVVSGRKKDVVRWVENCQRWDNKKRTLRIDVDALLSSAKRSHDVNHNEGEKTSLVRELLSNRLLLLYTVVMTYIWSCDGVSYYGVSLLSTKLAGDKYLNWILCGLVQAPASLTLPLMMDWLGRRKFMFLSHVVTAMSMAINVLAVFHTYHEGCDLIVPAWMTVIVRGASFSYSTAFPLWHLALTLERLMATQRANKYESTGVAFGIIASVLVWTISTGHTSFILWSAYQDDGFRAGSSYLTLYTRTSSSLIVVRTFAIIVLDCGTLVLDGIIAIVNRQKLKRTLTEYSLSRSYQIGENVAVTTRLILPWNVCNASLFLASKVAESLFRQTGLFGMSHVRQQAFLDLCFMVTLLQLPLSLLILLRFCQKLKRNVIIIDPKSETELFFQQFQKQINAVAETQRRGTGSHLA